jgi:hypothetical protein
MKKIILSAVVLGWGISDGAGAGNLNDLVRSRDFNVDPKGVTLRADVNAQYNMIEKENRNRKHYDDRKGNRVIVESPKTQDPLRISEIQFLNSSSTSTAYPGAFGASTSSLDEYALSTSSVNHEGSLASRTECVGQSTRMGTFSGTTSFSGLKSGTCVTVTPEICTTVVGNMQKFQKMANQAKECISLRKKVLGLLAHPAIVEESKKNTDYLDSVFSLNPILMQLPPYYPSYYGYGSLSNFGSKGGEEFSSDKTYPEFKESFVEPFMRVVKMADLCNKHRGIMKTPNPPFVKSVSPSLQGGGAGGPKSGFPSEKQLPQPPTF